MTTCYFETLAAFAVSCLLSAMIIPKISLIAFRRRLFDPLDDRKLHTTHIPRLGGIAFFPCIIMPISLVIACHNLCTDSNLLSWEQSTCLLTLFSCLFMLYLMGMRDDLIGMRYRAKFILQALNERTPRTLIVPISPGRSLLTISTPAALPCIASKALAAGREFSSSEFTRIIAPVTSDFF